MLVTESHPNIGRRKRLRERLASSQLGKLYDYEVLELFLYLSIPRRDTKIIAKRLISKFGSFVAAVNASPDQLLSIDGIGENVINCFLLLKEINFRMNKEYILSRPVISSKDALIKYLRSSIGNSCTEKLHILYLNGKNRIIEDQILEYGTTNQIAIYPREILKHAIFCNASAVIIAHNHPSGNTKPSPADIEQTTALMAALDTVNIRLHDHVIISSSSYYSFKSNDLL